MLFQYPFLDPSLSLAERVSDLLSRLSLEEKAGLVPTQHAAVPRLGIPAYAIGAEGAHGFVDREGPSTTFPQTIGLASSWDVDLLRKIGKAVGVEARAYYQTHDKAGGLALWSPTIDLERDPRWGRTEEGYGEDPFLTGELASAYIQGAQGDDPFYLRVSCGPKHFLANNNEKDRGLCSCSIPPRALREYYLAPFKTAIEKGKAASLMTSYNEVNGVPMLLHPMLKDVVKKEWGFDGHIVTDGGDFLMTVSLHHYFETHTETLASALKNGADSMTDDPQTVIHSVLTAIDKKLLTEAELDEHLARILSTRFRLGQFNPTGSCPYDAIDEKDAMTKEFQNLALQAVRESVTLLKNKEGLLPLKPNNKRIAVMGPLADVVYRDWYTGYPSYVVTPLDGLKERYGAENIAYVDCRDIVSFMTADRRPLVLDGSRALCVGKIGDKPARFYLEDWGWGAVTLTSVDVGLLLETSFGKQEQFADAKFAAHSVTAGAKTSLNWFVTTLFNIILQPGGKCVIKTWDNRRIAATDRAGPVQLHAARFTPQDCISQNELFVLQLEQDGLTAAKEVSAEAGVVIFFAGNDPMINGREEVDRPSLNLPLRQESLIRAVSDTNPNTVLVMISSYPYSCGESLERVRSALWLAHGIQETGRGLADILSGVVSPSGRLTLTWYKDESQLPPLMEYDLISARSTYQYFPGKVLFPFGFGLSYTDFTYSDLRINRKSAGENDTIRISFTVKNTGSVDAAEVPQLYTRVCGSRFRRSIKSLKGFTRLFLKVGEERRVVFDLPMNELAVWDITRGRFCVEQGYCSIGVGADSDDIRLTGGFAVRGETIPPRNMFAVTSAADFDEHAGCFLHEKRGSGVPAVFNQTDGAWVCYRDADFGTGAQVFRAVVQGTASGSTLEIRLDAPNGRLAGVVLVPNTGDVCAYPLPEDNPQRRPLWGFTEGAIERITGVHDVYLLFHGKNGLWQFSFACTESCDKAQFNGQV
ncbi:MAG: glycoside hydrolase family 3 C-terminal domain-containing protein [Treponema sp.]|jgi:beta-glucosidase|nr:glycoside hydrolase family 3 C-terminal domain-containing protein [Treponema sp.]